MTQNEYERAARALRDLESLGLDPVSVKTLWRALTERMDKYEKGEPGQWDKAYTVSPVPPKTEDHLANGDKLPQELSAGCLWAGHHYTLTPGQREWFRENTALTPSRTVTIGWVELWKGTQHPRSFKVISDVHVDPAKRRHLLNEYVVREAGRFFHEATENDNRAQERVEKVLSLTIGPVNVWSTKHKWAVKDLANVELHGEDIEIVYLDGVKIGFRDERGKEAFVMKDEFLETVADYVRLFKESPRKGKGKSGSQPLPKGFDEMMAELEKEMGE